MSIRRVILGFLGVYATLTWSGALAAAPAMRVCVNFGCKTRQTVTLPASDWAQLRQLLATATSAAGERHAIGRAIALLEDKVGRITGTWRDRGENWRRAGEPGELDCIAESRNTTTYLRAMEASGMLHWHRTEPRKQRGLIFTVHWTAVLQQISDGSLWSVDSWFRDNGQPPVIQTLQDWYRHKEP
jgi:hypothetical protein